MFSDRLPVGYSAVVVRPIDFIKIKHPLDFPCGAYFYDMRVSRVTGATCEVKVEVPVPATLCGGLYNVAAVPFRILFCDVVIIFHFLV